MLRRHTLWLASFLVAIASSLVCAEEAIRWAPNLPTAMTMASRNNQLVLLHFWAPGCGPCVNLERNVFTRPDVANAIARDFVPVKINAEAMPDTARKYKVDRWPMDVIVTPAGYPLFSSVSPGDPNEYMQMLYRVAAQRRPGQRMAESPTGPTDAVANLTQDGWGGNSMQRPENRYTGHDAQPPVTENRFTGGSNPQPQVNDGWGGQQSRFGPQYGEQFGSGDTGPRQPADQQPLGVPNETINPYVNNQPAPRDPRAQQGFGAAPRDPRVEQGLAPSPRTEQPRPSAPPQNANVPPMGLDGYCPVSLISDGTWKKGDERFGIIHRGRLYLFASEGQKNIFWQDPDQYAPILSGNDVVTYADTGRAVQGSRKHGVFFRNQIYLFTSEESLQRFWSSPQRYSDVAVQAMARASAGGRQTR